MYFDFQGFCFKNLLNNLANKIFCRKRKRQEIDFNYNYTIKKRCQTPIYSDDTNLIQRQNNEFSHNLFKKTFQKLNVIKLHPRRSSSCGNKSLNLSTSNLQENKYNFNDKITNQAIHSINSSSNLIKVEEKLEMINMPEIIKPKLVFKTEFLKNDEKIYDKKINENNFNNYSSFIEYSLNKDKNSFPTLDMESFETFVK